MRHLLVFIGLGLLLISISVSAQSPTSCASVGSRANSNGQATSCPNVNSNPMASNFSGTSYATVSNPSGKTGNLQLVYTGANAGLLPYAITRTWATSGGVTTLTSVTFGPAAVPVVNGSNTQVDYCFYNANLATIGVLTFEFTDPQTGLVWGLCSFDATCNSGCTTVANPAALLPVNFSSFKATATGAGAVLLEWTTASEQNNKGFTVERSIDGGNFESVGWVPTINPGGNSAAPSRYSYTDASVPNGQKIGYRLKQGDLDDKMLYSDIQLVAAKPSDQPGIFCDGQSVTVNFASTKGHDIQVLDTEGQKIKQIHLTNTRQYALTDLPKGHLYYISVKEDGSTHPTVKSVFLAVQ